MNLANEIKSKDVSPIDHLLAMAAVDMKQVDDIIRARMQSPVGMIPDLAEHLVGAGGKRLRPLLTIASAHLCEYTGKHHYKLAAAVEFIHSATLLHDDVVDRSAKRRGKKAANLIWGNAPSILVGDFLFARAFNLMVETGSLQALSILSTASSVIAEGEVQQLASLRDINMSQSAYMQVISAKTAALFAAATEVSPVLSKSGADKQAALRTYGQELGLAFQLVDDALDYGGFEINLGKSVGDDFREGKMTLPVIIAYANAQKNRDVDSIAFWHRVIVEHNQIDGDLAKATILLRQENALEATLDAAREHVRIAKSSLGVFDRNANNNPLVDKWRTALIHLADFVVSRVN